ncbi:MAG: DUF4919 domain-containing protein [Lutibacter sp.]
MRQFLTFAFLMIVLCNVNSQQLPPQKPNYDLINREIQDSSSNFYYPKLMSRLLAFDTTLSKGDYRHLYYGYIFQKEYQPYWTSPDEENLVKFYRSKKVSEKDYDLIIKLASHSISEFPFDLRQINYMGYIYHLKGDEEMAKRVIYRFHGILDAIMSSGDGKTCETGFHVISVSHEYVMLNMFQFQMKQQALIGDCDYMDLVKNERNIDGIYFNIKQLFDKNLENIKQE